MQVYKIQAGFVSFSREGALHAQESRAGYHFWCLRKARMIPDEQQKNIMQVEEVFEPQLAFQSAPHITIPLWTIQTKYDVTESNFIKTIYQDVKLSNAAQQWERAKRYLMQENYKFGFKHYGPLDPQSRYAMQNFIYNLLAAVMNITPVIFTEKSVFNSQIAEQTLLNSSTLLFSMLPKPRKTSYKIVAAINPSMLKPHGIDVSKIRLKRSVHHFWMLVKNEGEFSKDQHIQALHGLPMQYGKGRTGLDHILSASSVNTRNATLKIYALTPLAEKSLANSAITHQPWITPQDMQVVYDKENTLEIWMKLYTFVQWLNSKNIKYSSLGLGIGLFGRKISNGNSAFMSLGYILKQLTKPSDCNMLGLEQNTTISICNPMVSEKTIQNYINNDLLKSEGSRVLRAMP